MKQGSQMSRMRGLISTAVGNLEPREIAAAAALGQGDGIISIDPAKCRMNDQHRRLMRNVDGPELEALVESFKAVGQRQEAKGWLLPQPDADGIEVILIYGARRWTAAGRAGLPLRVRIVPEPTAREIAQDMHAENKGRVDYSAYERGMEFLAAMADGGFASQAELVESLGEDRSTVGRCIQIAQLPKEVVCAYAAPGQIPLANGAKLAGLIEADAEAMARVMAAAKAWSEQGRSGDPTATLLAAAEAKAPVSKAVRTLTKGKQNLGRVAGLGSDDGAFNLALSAKSPKELKAELVAVLEKYFPGSTAA